MLVNLKKEARKYLYTHNNVAYLGAFCTNVDFLSKNGLNLIYNYNICIFNYIIEYHTKLLKKFRYYFLVIIKKLKILIIIIKYFFSILVKFLFFFLYNFNFYNLQNLYILNLKTYFLKISQNVINKFKYPVILQDMITVLLKKNKLKIYKNYKVIYLIKNNKLNINYTFYQILLNFLGNRKKKLSLKKKFYNKIIEIFYYFCNQNLIISELKKTISVQSLSFFSIA